MFSRRVCCVALFDGESFGGSLRHLRHCSHRRFGAEDGATSEAYYHVKEIDGDLTIFGLDGIYRFDYSSERFAKSPLDTVFQVHGREVGNLIEDSNGDLYMNINRENNPTIFIARKQTNGYALDSTSLSRLSYLEYAQMCKIDLRVKYESFKLPREGDQMIMDFIHNYSLPRNQVQALNRCRCHLKALFFSDLTTADGKRMESYVFDPGGASQSNSRYKFPKEVPTEADWEYWEAFWRQHTDDNYAWLTPLGNWRYPTHRVWQWYYDEKNDHVIRRCGDIVSHNIP